MDSLLQGVEGFMYPNEIELQWSVLIVLYPFITGLVAGAFILASLERISGVEALRPTYRPALLSALAFLLVAPLPLQLHLGAVEVTNQVTGYQRRERRTRRVLAHEELELDPQRLITRSFWYTIDHELCEQAGVTPHALPGALHAV